MVLVLFPMLYIRTSSLNVNFTLSWFWYFSPCYIYEHLLSLLTSHYHCSGTFPHVIYTNIFSHCELHTIMVLVLFPMLHIRTSSLIVNFTLSWFCYFSPCYIYEHLLSLLTSHYHGSATFPHVIYTNIFSHC